MASPLPPGTLASLFFFRPERVETFPLLANLHRNCPPQRPSLAIPVQLSESRMLSHHSSYKISWETNKRRSRFSVPRASRFFQFLTRLDSQSVIGQIFRPLETSCLPRVMLDLAVRVGSGRAASACPGSTREMLNTSSAEPSRAEPSRADPTRSYPTLSRAEPSRAEP